MNPVLNMSLNKFCRKFLIKNSNAPEPSASDFTSLMPQMQASVCEQLIRHGTVAFAVYGENIPLAVLIGMFGVKGVERLLENKALKFVLWKLLVTYMVDDIEGIDPLQSGTLNSKAHCDPEESIALGFNAVRPPLSRSQKKNLLRKLRDLYLVPENDISKNAVKFGMEGYKSNKFKKLGLECTKDVRLLNVNERKLLCGLAEEAVELAIMSQYQLDCLGSYRIMQLAEEEISRLALAKLVKNNFDKIFDLENVPHLSKLYLDGELKIKDVPKLHSSKNTKRFRKWIYGVSSTVDAAEISKTYIDSLTHAGFFETKKGKILKTLTISLLGGAGGTALAGPIGCAIGATAAKAIEPIVDIGIDLLDELVLEGVLRGWKPRTFFDKEINPRSD